MTEYDRSKSPQSTNFKPGEQGGKIVDLNTLRALQKAAKQLNPRNTQVKEPTISITDHNASPPQKRPTSLQENPPVSIERSSSANLNTKNSKSPEDDYVFNVRSKFQQALSKLYAAETKDLAMSELKNIIAKNATPVTLRIFISSLCEYKKVATIPTQECEVFLFGYLAEVFREDLIDTRDKPPSIVKTCLRLIEAVQGYFNVTSNSVQQGCAASIAKIYNFSLLKQPVETKALLLYEPLGIIVTGGTDRASQATAGYALMEVVNTAVTHNDKEFLEEIRRRYIQAFLKINYEIPELIKCLGLVLYHTEIRLSGSKMHQILARLKELLQSTSGVYMVKVEAAQTLRVLGIKLRTVAESFIGNLHEEIITALRDGSKDRIIKVQNASNAALKEWLELKKVIEDVDTKKKRQEFEYVTPEELIKNRTGLGVNEALKENYSALADSLENLAVRDMPEKPDINMNWDQVSPGGRNNRFESNKKHTNFQKKKSGTGGGFVVLDKDKSSEPRAQETHQKQRQAIKDIVANNMEGRPMPFTDYDSKFQFFYPNQMNHPANAQQQFPIIENSSAGSMQPTAMQPNLRRPEQHEYRSTPQNLGDQLRPEQNATFQPKPKNIHSYVEQQILNEAYSTLKSQNDDINPLTHLADSNYPVDNSAQFLHGSNVRDPNDDARAKRQSKGFIIRTQPQARNLPPQESKSYLSPQNLTNSRDQNTALGDTTMPYPDLEDTMGYEDAEVLRAASQYGNTIPRELVQSHQRAAYEKEDPNVKPEQYGSISDAWEKVLESYAEGDIQGAYDRCLSSGDDLYLIRLMVKTGPCVEKLNRKTGLQLTNKIIKILNSQFLAKTCMGFFQEFFELNLVDHLALEDQNNMLKIFYELSTEDNAVGTQSAELYSLLLSFISK